MRRHVGILVLAALIVLALLLSTVCYQVDELQDVVMVSTFGKLGEPVWGRKPRESYQGRTAPGLHFKAPWPFQQLIRVLSEWAGLVATRLSRTKSLPGVQRSSD